MNALCFTFPGGMSVARDADEFLCVLRRLNCGHLTKAQAKEYRKLWPALLEVQIEPMQWPPDDDGQELCAECGSRVRFLHGLPDGRKLCRDCFNREPATDESGGAS